MVLRQHPHAIRTLSAQSASVTCVTVTYGERWHYLQQVLQALVQHHDNLDHIIVVNNGSSQAIDDLIEQHFPGQAITTINLASNTGSAGGFHIGMEAAYRDQSDYIWLLDDDTVPQAHALQYLLDHCLAQDHPDQHAAFCDRPDLSDPSHTSSPQAASWQTDSFLGFDIFDRLGRLQNRIRQKLSGRDKPHAIPAISQIQIEPTAFTADKKAIKADYAPYGGLLFPRRWIERIGLPNIALHTYEDDIDFTLRMTDLGKQIWLVPQARLSDLETDWNRQTYRLRQWLMQGVDLGRLYYVVRNRSWLEQKRQHYPLRHLANQWFYLTYLAMLGLFKEHHPIIMGRRLKLIHSAIQDARHNRMGARHELLSQADVMGLSQHQDQSKSSSSRYHLPQQY
ncbi:glycosyltransferase [Ampullimonas aquatilis]|uniref:glycosyltransferase n=1 Tax=Ampullimonas aquatilis TaxID=1341549 RepID=UPI003C741830